MEIKHYTVLTIIALAAFSSASVWAYDDVLDVHQQNDISYVSGGIGDDEKSQLEATQANYNFRVMNADKAGHFSGDTRIVISDLQHNVLLDAISGPLFYANLPKGKYIVEGYSQGETKKQFVTITKGKPAHIRYVWPQDSAE